LGIKILTVFIPCFNEGSNVKEIISQIDNMIINDHSIQDKINFVIIDDGSTDGSFESNLGALRSRSTKIEFIQNRKNMGLSDVEVKASKFNSEYVLGIPGDLRYPIDTCLLFLEEIERDKKKSDVYLFSDSRDRRGKLRQLFSLTIYLIVWLIYGTNRRNKVPINSGLICIRPFFFLLKPEGFPSWGSTPFYKYIAFNAKVKFLPIRYENIQERKVGIVENLLLAQRLPDVILSIYLLVRNKKRINVAIDEFCNRQLS
jgi:glycosyltransferase involved in cell wall biosynthesis